MTCLPFSYPGPGDMHADGKLLGYQVGSDNSLITTTNCAEWCRTSEGGPVIWMTQLAVVTLFAALITGNIANTIPR